MTTHQKPVGKMNAAQLTALYADESRHPNALKWEIFHASASGLAGLMLDASAPSELVRLARIEIDRRSDALANVRAELARINGVAR